MTPTQVLELIACALLKSRSPHVGLVKLDRECEGAELSLETVQDGQRQLWLLHTDSLVDADSLVFEPADVDSHQAVLARLSD